MLCQEKDKKERKWREAAAESGSWQAQKLNMEPVLSFLSHLRMGSGNGSNMVMLQHLSRDAQDCSYILYLFSGANVTNHDHVGGLKQMKFIFPLFSK